MMPVRSDDRSRVARVGVAEHRNEHRRHAVNRCTPFLFDGVERESRVEPGCGNDHRGAVAGAAEVGHHHAEAVIERHRNAQPVAGVEVDQLGREVPVVEDVAVRQRRTLRETGCARGVLDVDRLTVVECSQPCPQSVGADLLSAVDEAGPVVRPDEYHLTQFRCIRPDLVDHADVVRRLERGRGDQSANTRLLQDIGQFVRAVGRIDVDQDGADLRGRVLHDGPLGTVRRPHADALTAFDAQRHETACDHVDFVVELGVRPPPTACHVDERVPVGVCRDRALEVLPDRLLENRDVGRTCVG